MNDYAAVLCETDGQVLISEAEYVRQMERPDDLWICPSCGGSAQFDDSHFETRHAIA